jgi:TRAP transporter TAXI family solute receptor
VVSKHVPGYAANSEATAGSVANLQLMGQKKADIAFTMADAAWDGYKAQGKFAGGAVPLRTLMVAYPNRMHLVTVEGRGIEKFADLKGKRVSTGAPNSATELMAQRMLEAYGMSWDDFRRERLTPEKSVDAIKDGKLDAVFFVAGIPVSSFTDLAATPNTKIKLVDQAEAVEKMNAKYGPLYVRDTIPAKSYPGQDRVNAVSTVQNLIVARDDMPVDVAYNIVKVIFDKKDELIAVHKEAASFDLKNQTKEGSPLPYHPGAIKYFAEKGIKLN